MTDDAQPSTPPSTSAQPTNAAAATPQPPYAPASDPLARVPLYPEELRAAAGQPLTVAVTGATGYVAGAVVARLLAAGHVVHGTVRDPTNEALVGPLKALPGAAQRLRLFRADLMEAGSFDEAVAGCDYVLHTASPFVINVPAREARARLVEPAVRGVENVLAAVERSPSVKRVVLTSSVAAIMYDKPHTWQRAGQHTYDESCWNALASERVLPYAYSKTAAERRAWELCEQQSRWSLVALHPALVLGPPLGGRTDSESIGLVRRMLSGEMYPAAPYAGMNCVDVRDVAAAHCLAMLHPGAKGRYILVGSNTMTHKLAEEVAGLYPGGRVRRPLFFVPKWLVWLLAPAVGLPRDAVTYALGYLPVFDSSKVQRELGLRFTPLAVSLRDMVEDMAAKGIAQHPLPGAAAAPTTTAGAAGTGEGAAA